MIRNLERIARRPDPGGGIGTRLIRLARLVIRLQRHHLNGHLGEAGYRRRMQRLQAVFHEALESDCHCAHQPRTARQCAALLDDEAMLCGRRAGRFSSIRACL